jgi:hypothetical protein
MWGPSADDFGGWGDQTGSDGCYTVTGSNGHTTGSTTRTIVVTTTISSGGQTGVEVVTSIQTGTLVAAAVATGSSATPAATLSNAAEGRGPVNRMGAILAWAAGVLLAW